MSIDELVNRAYTSWAYGKGTRWTDHMRAALTEQAEAYEQRIDELTGVRLTVGDGLSVYGTGEAIRRAQAYILIGSSHPSETQSTARHFAMALQAAEARIRELEAQRVPEGLVHGLIYWVRQAPHGDDCFLHNDGGEFDRCFCGKDSLMDAVDEALAAPAPKEGE